MMYLKAIPSSNPSLKTWYTQPITRVKTICPLWYLQTLKNQNKEGAQHSKVLIMVKRKIMLTSTSISTQSKGQTRAGLNQVA